MPVTNRLPEPPDLEAAILAGGLSQRMGSDKARLRLHGRTLLAWTRRVAHAAQLPVRVVRRDLVPRCGPLGGIYTALVRTRARAVLFLPCDMPLLRPELLHRLLVARRPHRPAVFLEDDGRVGFPFVLPREVAPVVRREIDARRWSLQQLADTLDARRVRVRAAERPQLLNANTPDTLARLRRGLKPNLIVTKAGKRGVKTRTDLERDARRISPKAAPRVNFTAAMRDLKK